GRGPAHDCGGRGRVRLEAGRCRDACRAPVDRGWRSGARVDDVVLLDLARTPAAHGRARGRESAAVQRDRLAGVGIARAVADTHGPAPLRRPVDGEIAAEAD